MFIFVYIFAPQNHHKNNIRKISIKLIEGHHFTYIMMILHSPLSAFLCFYKYECKSKQKICNTQH